MIKKSALLFMLVVFVISIAGCETTKGAIQGAREDLHTAQRGAIKGAIKGWQLVQGIDDWMRKNLW